MSCFLIRVGHLLIHLHGSASRSRVLARPRNMVSRTSHMGILSLYDSFDDWPIVKRYAKLLAIYVIIAVAVVLLYAPWALALRPTDISIVRAGFSIICGIALAGVFGASTYLTLKDPDQKLLSPAEVTSADQVVPILREYVSEPYVGGIAADGIDQVESATRKHDRLLKAITAQFSKGSLTWDRFANLVEQATQTIIRNAALLANNVQSFDRVEYTKDLNDLKRAKNSNSAEMRVQREQVEVHEQSLEHMHQVIGANERMLLELGKLELEIGKLDAGDTLSSNDGTIEELETLIQETKYYG